MLSFKSVVGTNIAGSVPMYGLYVEAVTWGGAGGIFFFGMLDSTDSQALIGRTDLIV